MAGRPSSFKQETADEICALLAVGQSLREICRQEGFPDISTVMRWLADPEREAFREQYAHAKQAGIEAIAEEILDIADDARNDWMERQSQEGENIGWQFNGEAARRSQIRIDARKWLLSKLAPKKYGDRVQAEVSGPNGGPVESRVMVEFVGVNKDS
jgi:hypothetical protein